MNANRKSLMPLSSPGSLGEQAGFSLVELMIASVIGLVLLSGVVTIFSSHAASTRMSTGMTRVQESGGVALDVVSYGLRMAGYQGCRDATKEPVVVLASSGPTVNSATLDYPDNAIWGSEVDADGAWSPARHADLTGIVDDAVKPGTDVLYIRYGTDTEMSLDTDMADSGSDVVLSANLNQFQTGDLLMISDCNVANIFRATEVSGTGNTTIKHGTSGNTQSNFTQVFPGNEATSSDQLVVIKFESKAYFVAENGRGFFSLYELDVSSGPGGNPIEIIEGVEDFQVLYGVDVQVDESLPQNIRYVTAENVANPAQIVSVQLGLLVASAGSVTQENDTQIYDLAGHRVGPPGAQGMDAMYGGDRRFRAAFNTMVQIRNRVR